MKGQSPECEAFFPMTVRQAKEIQRASANALGIPLKRTIACGDDSGIDMMWIPPGDFVMGSSEGEAKKDERPQHSVRLTHGFYMGIHPVTQAQYEALASENPSYFKGKDRPVENVSWLDDTDFCQKLGKRHKLCIQLPTEARWEYACRAGTTTRYHCGDHIRADECNCDSDYYFYTGRKRDVEETVDVDDLYNEANSFGLEGMHGNVWEWCLDWYSIEYYQFSSKENPGGPDAGRYRVCRGGSYCQSERNCRSANRWHGDPDSRCSDTGFRIICTV